MPPLMIGIGKSTDRHNVKIGSNHWGFLSCFFSDLLIVRTLRTPEANQGSSTTKTMLARSRGAVGIHLWRLDRLWVGFGLVLSLCGLQISRGPLEFCVSSSFPLRSHFRSVQLQSIWVLPN